MDTTSGRFASRDSFEGALNTPFSQHKYLYSNANPVNYIDPSGLFTLAGVLVVTVVQDVRIAISLAQVRAGVKSVCALRYLVPGAVQLQEMGLMGIVDGVAGAEDLYALGRQKFVEAISQIPQAFKSQYKTLVPSIGLTIHVTGGTSSFFGAGGIKNISNAQKILAPVQKFVSKFQTWAGHVETLTQCLQNKDAVFHAKQMRLAAAEASKSLSEIGSFVNISLGPLKGVTGAPKPKPGGLKPSSTTKFNSYSMKVPAFIVKN